MKLTGFTTAVLTVCVLVTALVWAIGIQLIVAHQLPEPSAPTSVPTTPQWSDKETAVSGLLVPANEPTPYNFCGNGVPPDALLIVLGNSGGFSRTFPQTVISISGEKMLWIDQVKGELAVSAKFVGQDRRIVAQIDNNEFKVNLGNSYRKGRPDPHSLLIVDPNGREVLNVRFVNPKAIKITGVLRHPKTGQAVVISDTSGWFSHELCAGDSGGALFGFN